MSDNSATPIPLDDLARVVLPIVAVTRNAEWHAIGTSFIVAVPDPKRAVLLTAAHNLQYVARLNAPRQLHHSSTPLEFRSPKPSFISLEYTDVYICLVGSAHPVLAELVGAWFCDAFDVAPILVRIREDDDITFTEKLALNTSPIQSATRVMAVGFPGMLAASDADFEKGKFIASLQLQLQCKFGEAVRKCPKGIGIHKSPGFLVSCPLDSGMSGGPVIDLTGNTPTVRGIVAGDVSNTPNEPSRGSGLQAFASMLWTAMVIETQINIELGDGNILNSRGATLLDLVRHGFIDDVGRSHEHVRTEEHDGVLRFWWDSSSNVTSPAA